MQRPLVAQRGGGCLSTSQPTVSRAKNPAICYMNCKTSCKNYTTYMAFFLLKKERIYFQGNLTPAILSNNLEFEGQLSSITRGPVFTHGAKHQIKNGEK